MSILPSTSLDKTSKFELTAPIPSTSHVLCIIRLTSIQFSFTHFGFNWNSFQTWNERSRYQISVFRGGGGRGACKWIKRGPLTVLTLLLTSDIGFWHAEPLQRAWPMRCAPARDRAPANRSSLQVTARTSWDFHFKWIQFQNQQPTAPNKLRHLFENKSQYANFQIKL